MKKNLQEVTKEQPKAAQTQTVYVGAKRIYVGPKRDCKTPGEKSSSEPKYYFSKFQVSEFDECVYAVAGIATTMLDTGGDTHPLSSALKVVSDQLQDMMEILREQTQEPEEEENVN